MVLRLARRYHRPVAASENRLPDLPPPGDERALLKPCSNCGTFALTLPHQDASGRRYCSIVCRDYAAAGRPTFCNICLSRTSADHASTHVDFGLSWSFGEGDDECGFCASWARTLWLRLALIPVLPLGRYRVIQTAPQRFLSRKLV